MADYRCCLGSFTRANVLGLQTITGVADSIGTFTPTFLWLWTTQQGSDGFATDGHLTMEGIFPTGVGGQQFRMLSSSKINNSITFRAAADSIWAFSSFWDHLSQVNNWASLFSVGSGQFVLNWGGVDLSAGRSPCTIFFLALGGTDFSAKLGTLVVTSTGAKTITGVPFQPNGLFVAAISNGSQTYIPGVSVDDMPALGWTDGSNQGAACGSGIAGSVNRRQRTDRCGMTYNVVNSNYRSEYAFTSFNADGFTLNCSDAESGAFGGPGFYWYAFGGALPCACGTIIQPTSPGSQSVVLSGQPGAVLFMSHDGPVGSSPIAGSGLFSFGAVDALGNQFSTWYGVIASGGVNTATRGMFSTRAITCATPVGPPGAPTTTLNAAANATITATGFDVDFTTVDGTAREILWFAFGVGTVTPPPPPPPPPSVVCAVGTSACTVALTPRTGV